MGEREGEGEALGHQVCRAVGMGFCWSDPTLCFWLFISGLFLVGRLTPLLPTLLQERNPMIL